MERVIAYVDGYNLYYGLRSKGWKRFYWLNIQSLVSQFLKPHQNLVMTKYFTTVIKQPEAKRRRQSRIPGCAPNTFRLSNLLWSISRRDNYLPAMRPYLHNLSREDDRRKHLGRADGGRFSGQIRYSLFGLRRQRPRRACDNSSEIVQAQARGGGLSARQSILCLAEGGQGRVAYRSS